MFIFLNMWFNSYEPKISSPPSSLIVFPVIQFSFDKPMLTTALATSSGSVYLWFGFAEFALSIIDSDPGILRNASVSVIPAWIELAAIL